MALNFTIPPGIAQSMRQLVGAMQNFVNFSSQLSRLRLTRQPYIAQTSQQFRAFGISLDKFQSQLLRNIDRLLKPLGPNMQHFFRSINVDSILNKMQIIDIPFVGVGLRFMMGVGGLFITELIKWFVDKAIDITRAIVADDVRATGLGTTVGGLRAFQSVFARYPGAEQALANVATAQTSRISMQFLAMNILQVKRMTSSTEQTMAGMLAAQQFVKSYGLSYAVRMGMTQTFPLQLLRKMYEQTPGELQADIKKEKGREERWKITPEVIKIYKDLNNAFKNFNNTFSNEVIKALSRGHPSFIEGLTNVSKSVADFVVWVLHQPLTKHLIHTLKVELMAFALEIRKLIRLITPAQYPHRIEFAKRIGMRETYRPSVFRPGIPITHYPAVPRRALVFRPHVPTTLVPQAGVPRETKVFRPGVHVPTPESRVTTITPGRKAFTQRTHMPTPRPGAIPSSRHVRPSAPVTPREAARPTMPSTDVNTAINNAANATGQDPKMLRAIAHIESDFNPNNKTGSYKGLFQLSDTEFAANGGQGSIFNPNENAMAAAKKLVKERKELSETLGRPITDAELYMAHQQGVGGAVQHLQNPNRPAWESMYATREGQQKGPEWSRRAIWGNLPASAKQKFGSVENVTSGQFIDWWRQRYDRETGKAPTSSGTSDANPPPHPYDRRRGEPGEFNVARTGIYGPPDTNITQVTLKNGQTVEVNKALAPRYEGFLNELIDRGYPVNVGKGSGYQHRQNVNDPSQLSMHSYGAALDVNPDANPNKGQTTDLPNDIEEMAWRHGLSWGGRFGDPMHFEPMADAAWEHKKQLLRAAGKPDTPPVPETHERTPADSSPPQVSQNEKPSSFSQWYFQQSAKRNIIDQALPSKPKEPDKLEKKKDDDADSPAAPHKVKIQNSSETSDVKWTTPQAELYNAPF